MRRRREFEKWSLEKKLNKEQREMVLMVCDFKRANPDILPEQILRSQWLDQAGGIMRIKALFGGFDKLMNLAEEALDMSAGAPAESEVNDGQDA